MPYNQVLHPVNFPAHFVNRKQWEVQQALTALQENGAVTPDAEILGTGAGSEATIYHLSMWVRRVFATDLYVDAGQWSYLAPSAMLINPGQFAPPNVSFNARRIVVQHASMLDLPYEDNSFEGVFSSGSIEHVGDWDAVAMAAREMGRVLKPGGILSLSTEWRLSGDKYGWQGLLLFDEAHLMQYIVQPSGCQMVDAFRAYSQHPDVPVHNLLALIKDGNSVARELYLEHDGCTFTSVHIALRKPILTDTSF